MGDITQAAKKQWHDFLLHAVNNPKTSLIGLFSFLSVTILAITPFVTHKLLTSLLSIGSALVRVWFGLLLKDPGTVPARTPDNPNIHPEPSTELPLNPEAVIVHTDN